MGNTTSQHQNSRGCFDAKARDGGNGAKEGPALGRPETQSINNANPPEARETVTGQSLATDSRDPSNNGPGATASSDAQVQMAAPVTTGTSVDRGNPTLERGATDGVGQENEINENQEVEKSRIDYVNSIGRKQCIRIGTLNIHGKQDKNKQSKLKNIQSIMRKEKIAILAIQETRMDDETVERLEKTIPGTIIINNGNSSAKEGVAYLINKKLFSGKSCTYEHIPLIQNRLSALIITWKEDKYIIMNAYAPNENAAKAQFINQIKEKRGTLPKDIEVIMLGDWNMVEDAMDRAPQHEDDENAVTEFKELKHKLKLIDGWRLQNPEKMDYTYEHATYKSQARIDRIYTTKTTYKHSTEWRITSSYNITDHEMATIELVQSKAPYTGEGMKRFAIDLLEYPAFEKECAKMMLKAQKVIIEAEEPQEVWEQLQKDIMTLATKHKKQRRNEQMKRTLELRRKINKKTKKMQTTKTINDQQKIKELSKIKNELRKEDKKRLDKMENRASARWDKLSEGCNTYWFRSQKPSNDNEPITALVTPEGRITQDTKEMAKVAANYHENLQAEQTMNQTRTTAINKLLETQTTKLNNQDNHLMEETISLSDVTEALKHTQNGKCPGDSGIPFEFWKHWQEIRENTEKDPEEEPVTEWEKTITELDIIMTMTLIFNDIEKNGNKMKNFNKGVMCLLYKKKDKKRIENYRPVTLLNTDYKLLTKAIANKLGKVGANLIHPNQQGFIPKRSLYDSTRLTRMMIDYCEIKEENGCIVSLDQEKAYDKIAHDYLWIVLQHMNFPQNFINLIKELYKDANTEVMVNGFAIDPIKVKRGVRQGDPMSCLLYNIAIEPLASALRQSELQGFKIKGTAEKVLVSLFADDTLVYMNRDDDLKELYRVIDLFCEAATAKFNLEKTQYLPIGTKKHREEMIKTGKIKPEAIESIQDKSMIVKDQIPLRTLGAYVGNNVTTSENWNTILERQKKIITKWTPLHASYRGKELITKALVQSLAPFLMTVNDIPETVIKKMQKMIKDFIWDNRRQGYIPWEQAVMPKDEGGLDMPDIGARYEAIQIMWLKRWLAPPETRPLWGYVMDEILRKNIPEKPMIEQSALADWALQTWHEKSLGDSTIPQHVKTIIKTARKFNTGFKALKLGLETKNALPIWNHIGIKSNYLWNKPSSKCLRNTHEIVTTKDLHDYANSNGYQRHCKTQANCMKMAATLIDIMALKYSPNVMTPHRDNLDHTPNRKDITKMQEVDEEVEIVFDPNVTTTEHPRASIRVFQIEKTYKSRKAIDNEIIRRPAVRTQREIDNEETLILWTDGSAKNGKGGIGVYHKANSIYNRALRLPEGRQTNDRAELCAIIEAVKSNKNRKMKIKSDSKSTVEGIVKHLKGWEDVDYVTTANSEEWRMLAQELRQRRNTTTFEWVRGHSGIKENEEADRLANEGRIGQEEMILPPIKKEWNYYSARLQALEQKTAYKLILKTRKIEVGTIQTRQNIKTIQKHLKRMNNTDDLTTEKSIWKATRSKPYKKRQGDFTWKLIHGKLRVGEYFKRIPNWEDKQYCKTCGAIETPEHILLKCKYAKNLWKKIEEHWNENYETKWVRPSLHLLMAIPQITKLKGIKAQELMNIYRVYAAQATWSIWIERNKRIFEEKETDDKTAWDLWKREIEKTARIELEKPFLLPVKKQKRAREESLKGWRECKFIDLTEYEAGLEPE